MGAVFVGFISFAIIYYLIALGCIYAFFSRKRALPADWTPPISVLKPVKGLDFEAEKNFLSFLHQDYPHYQVLFGVQSQGDPAVPVIERLIREFPDRDIEMNVARHAEAPNRKVGTLAALSLHARHDLLVISDSDVRVAPSYLKEIAAPFQDPQVGMVTCLYRAIGAKNLPSMLESMIIHLDFLPAVLVAERLEGLRFGMGATMGVRRSALSAIGGFEAIRDFLADDYLLGYRIHQTGHRVVLSRHVVNIVMEPLMRMGEFLKHQVRWARTYRICRPRGYFASILTHGVFFAMVYLVASGFSPTAWGLLAGVGFVRLLMAGLILGHYMEKRSWLRSLLLLPLKEIVSATIWALAFSGNRITWKDKTFQLDREGRMS